VQTGSFNKVLTSFTHFDFADSAKIKNALVTLAIIP
tara:strand:- start:84 stop:191 length:108 start_codon:yes stop_codon:yes gene_type:complete